MTTTNEPAGIDLDNAALDKLEALARAATPGEWKAEPLHGGGHHNVGIRVRGPLVSGYAAALNTRWSNEAQAAEQEANAAYIAAANPETILNLIAQARASQPEGAAPRDLLNADELTALKRFDETCQDGEGYDVPKEMMQRLAEIGVVQRRSGAYYQITNFGMRILAAPASAQPDRGADEAIRNDALEAAALLCETVASDKYDQYKGRGKHAPNNPCRADTYTNGESDGANLCADKIRALKSDTDALSPASQPVAPETAPDLLDALQKAARLLRAAGFAMTGTATSQIVAAIDAAAEALAAHPDDAAVDRFASAMKAKMEKKRAEGRGGWADKGTCSAARLQIMLVEHLAKGDPVDIGNFAMMLWNRGEPVAAPTQAFPNDGREPDWVGYAAAEAEPFVALPVLGKDAWADIVGEVAELYGRLLAEKKNAHAAQGRDRGTEYYIADGIRWAVAELQRRFRAQGGSTNDSGSNLAPEAAHAQQEAAPADPEGFSAAVGAWLSARDYWQDDEHERVKQAWATLLKFAVAPSDAKDATVPDHSEREAANAEVHGPKTLMTDEQAFNWAWTELKKDLGAESWNAGDEVQSWAFFKYGWDHRTQLELQRYKAPATIAAGQEAANAKDAAQEIGWCLERGPSSTPQYLHVAETGIFGWTPNHMKALRFSRRSDAEQVAYIVEDADRIAEHVWVAAPSSAAGKEGAGGQHG